MITLTMMILKSIVLFLALVASMNYIGQLVRFYIEGMIIDKLVDDKGKSRNHIGVAISHMNLPAMFWAIFYFLTF
jgi:hypothetical protein